MCISSPAGTSPEEIMDTTPSWQVFNSSEWANHGPGFFPRDNIPEHPSHLVGRVTQGEQPGAPPCASPSDAAQDHPMMYSPHDTWNLHTPPPLLPSHDAAYGPPPTAAADTTWRYDHPSHSSSDPHHSGDPYVPFSTPPPHQHQHYPSPPALMSPSFTPINQHGSNVVPFRSPLSKASRTRLC